MANLTNLNNKFLVTTGGDVGIGATSPRSKLEVAGGIMIQNGENLEWGNTYANNAPTIFASTNYLQFAPTGASGVASNSMKLTTTGLGIGTTSPSFKLDVDGSVALNVMPGHQSEGSIQIGRYDGNTTRYNLIKNYVSSTQASNYMKFAVHNGTEGATLDVMTLLGSGNVGINKTSTLGSHALSIKKVSNQQLGLYYDETNFAAFGSKSNGDVQIYGYNGSSLKNILLGVDGNTAGGNVGIGTTSPGTKLQVANAGEVIVRSSMTAADGYRGGFEADNQHTGGTIWSMFSTNNSDGYFGGGKYVIANESMGGVDANTTAKFVIDGNGNVGIGTTSPASVFEVYGGGSGTNDVDRYVRFKASNGEKRFDFYMGGTGNASSLGMYTSDGTTKNVQIASGGTSYLNGGNVGIGVTNPSSKLTVDGLIELDESSGAHGFINTDGTNYEFDINRNPVTGAISDSAKGCARIAMRAEDGGAGSRIIFATAAANNTTATERMRIDKNGNIGIGTTALNQTGYSTDSKVVTVKAPVSGGASALELIGLANADGNLAGAVNFMSYAETAPLAQITGVRHTADTAGKLYFKTSGNTVLSMLQDQTAYFYNTLYFSSSGVGSISWGSMGGGTGFGIRGESGRGLSLGSNGAWDKMIIDTSGNVAIGTTATQARLEVRNAADGSTTAPQFLIYGGASSYGAFHFLDSNAYHIETNSAGRDIEIICNTGGVKLGPGDTSWSSNSDENLKENIKPLHNVLDKIKDYRCVEYNFKDDENEDKKIGFIAQDWQKDFSQVVNKNKQDVLSIKYTETIPILLKAIQELEARIKELENK